MKLNRKQRRAKRDWRRPSPTDSPADQMKALLKAPGKFHIVQLAEGKSFIVKPTDDEMPIFLTMCQQLRGVLGYCEAIPATPVEAAVAGPNEIANDTAQATKRIREARQRQDAAVDAAQTADDELASARLRRQAAANHTLDAMTRHPAGKQRSGRHRAPEPDTTFDRLVAAGPADDQEGARRLAALEIAAAQDDVARHQDALEAANQRLRDAYDAGGELHNRSVLEKFAERVGDEIANQQASPPNPQWQMSIGRFEAESVDQAEPVPTVQEVGIGGGVPIQTRELHRVDCQFDECGWSKVGVDKGRLAIEYGEHMAGHQRTGSPRRPAPPPIDIDHE